MALHITEFTGLGLDAYNKSIPAPLMPPVTTQTVAIGAGSLQSAAFNSATRIIRLHATDNCYFEFGSNPTASSVTSRMVADSTEYFAVPENVSLKVAAITSA